MTGEKKKNFADLQGLIEMGEVNIFPWPSLVFHLFFL